MKQGGKSLEMGELKAVMSQVEGESSIWSGLAGIDHENMAPYFDDALESLVQGYGVWDRDADVDAEYNRRDLRDEAIRRALWAVLVCQGYMPYGGEGYGMTWPVFTEARERLIRERTEERARAYEILRGEGM